MDNLIVMTPRTARRSGRGPVGGSAEILFFTGVRYFRQVEEAAFLPAAPVPRRRRSAKAKTTLGIVRLEQQHA